jgi:6-phosphogluconolactonase (cycloisomerase 2 family)
VARAKDGLGAVDREEDQRKHRSGLAVLLVAVAAALIGAHASSAEAQGQGNANRSAVFVQTNQVSGNAIVVYDRAADGTLSPAGTYATGGNGGAALGAESDRLASQSSLVYDSEHKQLIAVNAGSDTVSAFRVKGDRLELEDVLPSGGQFPASVGVHDDLAYVLNSGGTGIVQGFRVTQHGLEQISGSARSLGLANTTPPNFLTAPGQVGFTPNGSKLIVTTKASTNSIDVFTVEQDGTLSAVPVANSSATPVPFAFTFGPASRLVAGEAGASSVTTYRIGQDGTLADPKSQTDGQAALCWIQRVGRFYFVTNTASNNVSAFRVGSDGQPSLVNAVAATTNSGPIDIAASGDSLYVETGLTSTVDEFRVDHDGALVPIGTVTGLPPGIEGIASS